jgi:hypothetical protein
MGMKRLTILLSIAMVWMGLTLSAIPSVAQEEEPKPKPAARVSSPPIDAGEEGNQQPQETLQADQRPLTGVQTPTLGTPELRHSYWVPGIQYGNTIQNQALNLPTPSGWYSNNYVAGNLSLLEAWSHSKLSLNYSGGGVFSTDSTIGNGYFHELSAMQEFTSSRWQLQFLDQFSYLPESQFGFGGVANLNIPGISGSLGPPLPGLQSNYVPNQSIFTSVGSRYSNAGAVQLVYALSSRGSVTFSGSYGMLRFNEAGSIDTDDEIGSIGYSYAVTKNDTIGLVYRFSAFHYSGNPQAIGDQSFNVAYGRKITAKLALQLYGGPNVTNFRVPIGGKTNRISGGGGGTLNYGFKRGTLSLTYDHSVTGGSGIFLGSRSDLLQTGLIHQLGRVWSGNMQFGFARNRSLINVAPLGTQDYSAWFAGAGLSRSLGHNASFTLGYTARIQTTNLPVLAAGTSDTSYLQHLISLNFQWHTRPLVLR